MIEKKQTSKPCIITIDDDSALLAILKSELEKAGYDVIQATSAEQALRIIVDRIPDLALLDAAMPGTSSIELVKYLHEKTAIPFIFLSSHQEADIVRQAAQSGAIGYLAKPVDLMHIIPAVEAGLIRAEEIRELRRVASELAAALSTGREAGKVMRNELDQLIAQHTEELKILNAKLRQARKHVIETKVHARKLARMANEDALTALPNRNWLMRYLPAVIERARNNRSMLALLFLDLDGFKGINDALGHLAGDELLRAAALRMKSALKPTDRITRHGGDEFIIVIEQVVNESDASNVAQRMAEVLKNPFELSHGSHAVGVSIGISLYPRDGENVEELLKNSDRALYRAKSEGKGHYRFYDPGFRQMQCS